MNRSYALLLIAVLSIVLAMPAISDAQTVKKRTVTGDSGETIHVLDVTAGSRTLFGVMVEDASASIEDVFAPEGWVAIATEDRILFRTLEKPTSSGKTVSLHIVTGDAKAKYSLSFRDKDDYFGEKKEI